MSVQSDAGAQATCAATLFDEWVVAGLRDVVLCPGSRSTPLALAAHRDTRLRVHVRLDERSAAFFAIGRALVTQRPVAIVVTSGTAAAELHAAVAEADQACVPLLVLTADRPPRLHGVGAPQTITQTHLFGDMVRGFFEPAVPTNELAHTWRSLARASYDAARGGAGHAGPVHLNMAFEEPLLGDCAALPLEDGELLPLPTPEASATDLISGRVLAVVGAGTSSVDVAEMKAMSWVVLSDATMTHTMPLVDALLRDDHLAQQLAPDVIVRCGGLPASKVLGERMVEWQIPVVGFDGCGPLADPQRLVSQRLHGVPRFSESMKGDPGYVEAWTRASQRAQEVRDDAFAAQPWSEPAVAAAVVGIANRLDVPLVIGSSMPIRNVEWWADARTSQVFANRGVNGIDGVISTICGVASGASALGYVGDLTMLHDVSALVEGVGEHGGSAVVVVSDNDGGGIFNFLSQGQELAPSEFELLFGTPRSLDLVAVVGGFGHHAVRVASIDDLHREVVQGLGRDGLTVVVAAHGDRRESVAWQRHLVAEIAASARS